MSDALSGPATTARVATTVALVAITMRRTRLRLRVRARARARRDRERRRARDARTSSSAREPGRNPRSTGRWEAGSCGPREGPPKDKSWIPRAWPGSLGEPGPARRPDRGEQALED